MFIKEKAARFISAIEDAKIPLYVWAIYFYGFAIARGLLEGLLEYHKTIPPAEALFLHFPLWYFNVFLSLSIIVSFFTGEKLWKTAKVIFLFTPLLLLVPVFDFLVSGGRGYMLGYAYDFESFSKVLLSVGGIIPGSLVSPGQSTLAWLAIFLISGYCFVKSVRIHKILLLVAIIYFVLCMYASVKFIVCSVINALALDCNFKVSSVLFLFVIAMAQLTYLKFYKKRQNSDKT